MIDQSTAEAQSATVETDTDTDELQRELAEIEFDVTTGFTLADAMREGSKGTRQACGWGDGTEEACAIHAAFLIVRKHGCI